MKKIISLLLTLTMCITICACSNEKVATKEELAATAEVVKIEDILYEIEINEARAKNTYNGKLVKIENYLVEDIYSYENHAELKNIYWGGPNSVLNISAKVSNEDAMSINNGETVTIVGTIDIGLSTFMNLNDAFIVRE